MSKENDISFVKQKIKDIVFDKTGIRSVELISVLIPQCLEIKTEIDYPELLEKMVDDKEIMEVEIIHPSFPERIKSMYFPVGTGISVRHA